ncbi:hypothetical protein ZWY2020_034565 [Hordeum vulgare]|nr:hypothetical protein ZWY2020_034565 [Hordeum vulgare]
MSDFYSMLLSCESLKEQNAFAPEFSTSANAVARLGDDRGGQYNGGQQAYRGNNRPNQGGGGGGNGGGGQGNGGGRHNNRRERPRCQVCRYWGHETLQSPAAASLGFGSRFTVLNDPLSDDGDEAPPATGSSSGEMHVAVQAATMVLAGNGHADGGDEWPTVARRRKTKKELVQEFWENVGFSTPASRVWER